MFLVDTSIWIDFLNRRQNPALAKFQAILDAGYPFGISGIIYQEILQGAKTQAHFNRLEEYLRTQRFYEPLDCASHRKAAKIYFSCRRAGITLRSTIDCLIAQTAIDHKLYLLHNDRDFSRMSRVVTALKLY